MKRRKLIKIAEVVALKVEAKNVANFLAAWRKQMPKLSMPCMVDVEAFFANEPVEASLLNAVEPVLAELLQVPGGPLPTLSILGHPLGLNIHHILEDLYLELEDLVGMRDDHGGHPIAKAEAAKPPPKPLSLILEAGSPTGVDKASGSKRPRTYEAS